MHILRIQVVASQGSDAHAETINHCRKVHKMPGLLGLLILYSAIRRIYTNVRFYILKFGSKGIRSATNNSKRITFGAASDSGRVKTQSLALAQTVLSSTITIRTAI